MVDYTKVPTQHMVEGVRNWVEHGVYPGSFLTCCFANDLYRAASKADMFNRRNLYEWAIFMFNELPADCWGSYEQLEKWRKSFEQ